MSLSWVVARLTSDVSSWPERIHPTEAGFASHVDSPVLKHFMRTQYDGGQAFASPATSLEDVDLTQPIHATQPVLLKEHLTRYLDNPQDRTNRMHLRDGDDDGYEGDRAPTFVRWRGQLHATDGQHRVGAELVRGTPSMKGYVYDADRHGFTDENLHHTT